MLADRLEVEEVLARIREDDEAVIAHDLEIERHDNVFYFFMCLALMITTNTNRLYVAVSQTYGNMCIITQISTVSPKNSTSALTLA